MSLSKIVIAPLKSVAVPCHNRRLRPQLLSLFSILVISLSFGLFTTIASAAIEVYEFDSPQQEAQYRGLIAEFRCPKCQNQSLAGSDSQISQDLKRKTYQLVMTGQTDAQIRDYMYERYGDFISYKPPVRPSTWILWFLPPALLLALISWWLWRNAKAGRVLTQNINANSSIKPSLAASINSPLQGSQSNSAVSGDTTFSGDNVQSGLTTDETIKLQSLLNKHGTNSDKSLDEDNQ